MKEKSYNDVSDGLDDFLSQSLDLIGGLERLVDQVFGLSHEDAVGRRFRRLRRQRVGHVDKRVVRVRRRRRGQVERLVDFFDERDSTVRHHNHSKFRAEVLHLDDLKNTSE